MNNFNLRKRSTIFNSVRDNDVYKTYKTLTNDEKDFIFKHPFTAYKFKDNAIKASDAVSNFQGARNGYGDAIRHCYWCALNQMDAGLNSSLAKEYGDAHENFKDNDINERTMDLHNNSVGYNLGNIAIIKGWNKDELLNQVINAARNGQLKTLK